MKMDHILRDLGVYKIIFNNLFDYRLFVRIYFDKNVNLYVGR